MFNELDVVKWKNPQTWPEREDVMVVEGVDGIFVHVRHVSEDGFGGVSSERMEDLKFVGRCSSYELAEDIYRRYEKS